MQCRASGPLRTGRAVAFATVCVALTLAGHVLAGGSLPGAFPVAIGGLAVLFGALIISGRRRRPETITLSLVAAQAGLHELFGSGFGTVASDGSATGHAGHGSGLGMTLAHLVAAVLTGLWLARGEDALWSLLRLLGALLLPGVARVAVHPELPLLPARPPRAIGTGAVRLRHSLSRRGPPLRPAF